MIRRRDFITLLGSAATWPLAAGAQQPIKILRVGTVAGNPRSGPQWVAFERRMGELGYQEGKNFFFDFLQIANAADESKPATRSSRRARPTSFLLLAQKSV